MNKLLFTSESVTEGHHKVVVIKKRESAGIEEL